jgi:hypothetical protein
MGRDVGGSESFGVRGKNESVCRRKKERRPGKRSEQRSWKRERELERE